MQTAEASPWRPSEGKYLAPLGLATLRNYLRALFAETPTEPVSLARGTEALQRTWRDLGLDRSPQRSHAYRHLLAQRLLGLVVPHGRREGYMLSSLGRELLSMYSGTPTLSSQERHLLASAMFRPPDDMDSPLVAFANLFGPGPATPADFAARGQAITLWRRSPSELEVDGYQGNLVISGRDAVTHVLWGCRKLFIEAGLVSELPPTAAGHTWPRTLFPVRELDPSRMDDAVQQVVSDIRQRLNSSTRIPIPGLGFELRPQMLLGYGDYDKILTKIAKDYGDEFYFDRVSLSLIAGREEAYIRIGEYWRSSIVRR